MSGGHDDRAPGHRACNVHRWSIRSGHRRQRLHRRTPRAPADRARLPCVLPGARDVARRRTAGGGRPDSSPCDIADRAGVARAIASSNARFVFHLAGLVRAMDPGDFMRVNAGGVERLRRRAPTSPTARSSCWSRRSRRRGRRGRGRSSRAIRRCRSPITVAASSPVSRRPCGTPMRCPSRSCGPASCSALGTEGCYEVFRPIARSGLHVVGGSGEPPRLARRRGGSRRVPRARGGAGRAARARRPGTRHLLRRCGGCFVRRTRHGDRARAREAAAPHSPICRDGRCGRSACSATSCRGSAGARGGSAATRSATFSQVRGRARRRKPGSNWAGRPRPRSPIDCVKPRSGTATRTGFE